MKFELFKKRCTKCFFMQNNSCILNKSVNLPCDMKIRKIQGVDGIEFYLNYINSRKQSRRAIYISVASLIIASAALFVNAIKAKL